MKKFTAEVTIGKDEIEILEFIRTADAVSIASHMTPSDASHLSSKSPAHFSDKSSFKKPFLSANNFMNSLDNPESKQNYKTTKPIPIAQKPGSGPISSSAPTKAENIPPPIRSKNKKKHNTKNYDLMQTEDIEDLDCDFDFEGNLALFDKKEIFKEIDNEHIFGIKGSQKPDLVRQLHKPEEKYRHDENVLDSMMMQFKNVQLEFKPKQEYFTDEAGIIIPSIPQSLRNRIQNLACDNSHTIERQNDFLARGATELALNLLGGSRRLSTKNFHQWPKVDLKSFPLLFRLVNRFFLFFLQVTIICDEPYNFRSSEVGLSCGRQLASHGLKVMIFVKTSSHSDKTSKELSLFTATGNDFTGNVKDLPSSDLVIMSVTNMNQNSQIIRYIQSNRAPVMAIDPPATGLSEILIRNAIVPILPLDDINNTCGKLHLVNICIAEKFFKDAGIKYSPIFGSKFIIPLHLRT